MKFFSIFTTTPTTTSTFLTLLLLLAHQAAVHVAAAAARPQSYAVWAAESGMARHQGNGLDANGNAVVSYEHGVFWWGLRLLFERAGDERYFGYVRDGVDNIVFGNGSVHGNYK
jgi:rhamnogalacturonyl hydrolase YesR